LKLTNEEGLKSIPRLWRAVVCATIGLGAGLMMACSKSPEVRVAGGGGGGGAKLHILVFSRTAGYRHASIPDGIAALRDLAAHRGWQVVATEDPSVFRDETLAAVAVVVFLNTTGDVLDADQQGALERHVRAGKGWVGIHAAADTEYGWPWYGGLVGAYFRAHPAIQEARIRVEAASHPAARGLPDPWTRTDEWYAFRENPRPRVNVVLSLDETSYAPGNGGMDGDHPVAWYHLYDGGRSFYTALGHTEESYRDPAFLNHLGAAIAWAGGT
jgi:type 1 glutamine amidotransferase